MATGSPVPDQLPNQMVSVFRPRRFILSGSRTHGDAREVVAGHWFAQASADWVATLLPFTTFTVQDARTALPALLVQNGVVYDDLENFVASGKKSRRKSPCYRLCHASQRGTW